MNGLKKISGIALLAFLPYMALANDIEVTDLTTVAVMVAPAPIEVQTPTDDNAVEMPTVGAETATEVEPVPMPEVEPPVVSPSVALLEKAKRENAKRANMRHAELTDTECLALAMYHEARGEGTQGMKAVAFVIYNRMKSGRFPNSICQVVLQKSQFSFIGDRNTDSIKSWGVFEQALAMSVDLLDNNGFENEKSPVGNALFFNSLARGGKSVYSYGRKFIATIGNHHFFK